ncbi:MAG: hydrogenase/urease maturation nickel metallochaperone HypA [Candidatus Woesearchaeota archaeon]
MHETIIANDIINKAKEQGQVKEITVEVGDLAHLPANELKETLSTLVKWKVNIIEKEATIKCSCGYQGAPKILEKGHDSTVFVCPKCNETPDIIDGKDIILKEVIID